jgi:hypothetical protein
MRNRRMALVSCSEDLASRELKDPVDLLRREN